MPSVFALLVGINTYHKDSGVSSLNGCVNDIDVMQEYLRTNFASDPESNILVLKNEQASRSAVIENFKRHLIKNPGIKEGDTVLFYYSGHGSFAPTAPEFVALNEDSKKQDETLVLYDSRLQGNYDLADKELALLLSKIPDYANAVVILDSCHSGSATKAVARADEIRLGLPRFTPASTRITSRALSDYASVDGHGYFKMFADGKLEIPKSKHLLFAACGRNELAYESASARGLFSSSLTDLLQDSPASYAQLYEYVYAVIKRKAARQTPQLKTYEGFNANFLFLQNSGTAGKPVYNVVFKKPDWVINYGALHGLPVEKNVVQACAVQLYAQNDPFKPLYTATVKKVGLNESILQLSAGINTEQLFHAEVLNLPPALLIYVDGAASETETFFSLLKESTTSHASLHFHQDASLFSDFILDVQPHQLVICSAGTRQIVHGIETFTQGAVDYIIKALLQIAKWNALQRLENTQTAIPSDALEFVLQLKGETGNWIDSDGSDLTLDITEEQPAKPFQIKLTNTAETPYYFALYRLSSTFAIEKQSVDVDASLLQKGAVPKLECNAAEGEEPASFVMDDDALNEETEIYKLVYSTDVFSDYFVEEREPLEKRIVSAVNAKGVSKVGRPTTADWAAKTITVRIVRKLQQVNDTQGYDGPVLSIKPHPSFSAAVSITPIDTAAKSYNPAQMLEQAFCGPTFSILHIGEKTRSDAVPLQAVVELTDIANPETLAETPLEVTLNYKLEENEQVMAVTYSDGLVVPVGLLEKAIDNKHVMKLYNAPAEVDGRRAAAKSPVRALWFCFLKVALGKKEDVFKLRFIDYKEGKPFYPKSPLDEKVAQSNRILLLIHGIIGNTKSIATNMECFLKEGKYDCILSFDYENLNTSIAGIAEALKKRLEDSGVSENKQLDIIAHSMGGLVSRYMIERLGGDKLVDRLFLIGTPNNGSAFGELVTIRNWATGVLTLACNYGKSFLGAFGPFLEGVTAVLGATKPITNTLAEMKTGSDFINSLNKAGHPVSTRYYILAGNTATYIPAEGPIVKGWLEKLELAIGKLAYWHETNDIAVSVQSIKQVRHVPVENVVEIGCHHLNYFDYELSLNTLKKLMQ